MRSDLATILKEIESLLYTADKNVDVNQVLGKMYYVIKTIAETYDSDQD